MFLYSQSSSRYYKDWNTLIIRSTSPVWYMAALKTTSLLLLVRNQHGFKAGRLVSRPSFSRVYGWTISSLVDNNELMFTPHWIGELWIHCHSWSGWVGIFTTKMSNLGWRQLHPFDGDKHIRKKVTMTTRVLYCSFGAYGHMVPQV